ncbi:hypothetical protein [Actinoplanes aureus]|uniref:Uncharacterized protein n=1 Tax=Actinoplanes aureus TaxID=2792083 RepID=A0A931C1Y7_9ACTN|nr:hypothetical protein [Actinoplanes aureus]MBG0561845.1 hypothetical protein [Actinoplanes aureus]
MTEMRYRRLLALYPRDFRQEYEEEMLAVLMTDDRRGPAQVLDVARAAVTVRFRLVAGAVQWRRAAWAVQLFGAIVLLSVALRRFLMPLTWSTSPFRLDAVDGTRVAGWAVVVVAALLGWRLLGFAGAAAGLAGEIASPARYYYDTPASVLHVYWIITAAAVVLIAGLVALRAGPRPRGWLAVVREPEVRRWMLAWAAPVLVTIPLVRAGFGAFIEHNMRHPESLRLIAPYQWVALVIVPVAAFVAVAVLNRRLEATRFRLARAGTN